MPIYEYKCAECSRRVSLFFPSFNIAEERIAAGETKCPRCGSPKLTRLMSRVYSHRADDDSLDDLPDGGDMLPEGLDDEDPRAIARWARRMKDSMGDDMDMGPEFDQALARIEAGEDPDKVMEDIDVDALGGGGGMDDADDGGDDDFGPSSIGLG
jgi:putative FmdB family regulatory protein